jgi:hypothetical protein
MDKLREEFESWLKDEYLFSPEEIGWQKERNCYAIYGVHLAWCAWRARTEIQNEQQNIPEIIPVWQMVPVEPTKEMVSAGQDKFEECINYGFDSCEDGSTHEYSKISSDAPYQVYQAMLAAAPEVGHE